MERAYSAHAHELARGFETLRFEDAPGSRGRTPSGRGRATAAQTRLYESAAHRHQAYRQRGEYAPQLSRLVRLLGRDRIKVVDSHRFFETPQEVYVEILDWLGVAPRRQAVFDRYNGRPRLAMPSSLHKELSDHFTPYDEQLTDWLGHVPTWRR